MWFCCRSVSVASPSAQHPSASKPPPPGPFPALRPSPSSDDLGKPSRSAHLSAFGPPKLGEQAPSAPLPLPMSPSKASVLLAERSRGLHATTAIDSLQQWNRMRAVSSPPRPGAFKLTQPAPGVRLTPARLDSESTSASPNSEHIFERYGGAVVPVPLPRPRSLRSASDAAPRTPRQGKNGSASDVPGLSGVL